MKLRHAQLRLLCQLLSALEVRNASLACLRHVYFTPMGAHTIITATDLDVQFYWPVPLLDAPLPESTSCPIAWFLKLADEVKPGGHLELRPDRSVLCLYPSNGPSARSPERSLPIKDAPPFSTLQFTRGGWLSHPTMEKAVQSIPFISTDVTRHVINGVHITTEGHLVATDGRRLAHSPTRGTTLPRDIIMPTRAIKAFEALANGTVENSGITYGPEHLRMQCWLTEEDAGVPQLLALHSGCYLRTRLIDGVYPNWKMVIPGDFSTMVDIDPEFIAVLKVAMARSARREYLRVVLVLEPGGTVTASVRYDKEGSDVIDPVKAGTHTISPSQPLFRSAWNAAYLLHCLQFSGTRLYCIDDRSPLRSGNPGEAETVLMPLRLAA